MARTCACDAMRLDSSLSLRRGRLHGGKTSLRARSEGPMERCNSSMQLTRAADYGVRVMIHLAGLPRRTRLSLQEIAVVTEAPESFLSKILQSLTHADLITSRRGQSGGFEISPAGRRSSMQQVIEAIDGPIHLNLCLNQGKPCSRKSTCPAHPVWARAQRAMLAVLESALISDLARKSSMVAAEPSLITSLVTLQETAQP